MHKKDEGKRRAVVLIGFMGSGKTTVGIRLSYKLRMSVEDTDKLIERKAGCSISEIFSREGEAVFRDMETNLLRELSLNPYGRVLSVGGGTPMREENRELLQKCGTVVYLRVRPETVYERIKGDTTRPLLQCDDPLARIRELLKARQEKYEACADVIVDVDDENEALVADKILAELERRQTVEKTKRKLLVINGPNLNFLGIREKAVYGTQDYSYLVNMIREKGKQVGVEVEVYQSNHEGAIIDRIQEAYFDGTAGIVINPGAYTHYSYAIHDALASVTTIPKIEVHISDITKREDFRKLSVTAPACDGQIYGHGLEGYCMAIDAVMERIGKNAEKA